mmetsp:Transcript_9344/g.56938  ORF Transcript_9344/g.56938 Transcript_9344/m.56938 type:complete len:146 (-) Transcript_9344:716-1153(-)
MSHLASIVREAIRRKEKEKKIGKTSFETNPERSKNNEENHTDESYDRNGKGPTDTRTTRATAGAPPQNTGHQIVRWCVPQNARTLCHCVLDEVPRPFHQLRVPVRRMEPVEGRNAESKKWDERRETTTDGKTRFRRDRYVLLDLS